MSTGNASYWGVLVRHFWGRFFDTESLSPQGEPQTRVTQALGVLAVPSAFFVIIFRPLTLVGWDLVAVRYIFVSFSMIVMAFITVVQWDALFPDRRDYQILTPLPIRLSTMFLAKLAALGMFLGIFLLDINFFSVILWPGIDGNGGTIHIWACHLVAVVASGLFAAVAMAAVQGVLITVLSVRAFQRASVLLQTLLIAALVMLFFLTHMLAFGTRVLVNTHPGVLYALPPYWFLGLYEHLRPATEGPNPVLLKLGTIGVRALMIATSVLLLTYVPLYRQHARKAVEAPVPDPRGGGWLSRGWSALLGRFVLRQAVERAVFHFMSQTITRSLKHRLFLAMYGGFGAALAVMNLGSGRDGLLTLPLMLSFVLVSGLRAAFNFPSELRANWAFQLSESHQAEQYLAAMRKWIVVCAIGPLFTLLAPMEFTCFTWRMAAFHLAFGVALSLLLMDIMFFGFRKVPFTCAYFPGKMNLIGLGAIYIFGFTVYSRTMAGLEQWLSEWPPAALAFFALMVGARLLLAYYNRRQMRETPMLDYEDAGDPVVRTLGLSDFYIES